MLLLGQRYVEQYKKSLFSIRKNKRGNHNDCYIISRLEFLKLLYQCCSYLPRPLIEAFHAVAKEPLLLKEDSPVKLLYGKYSRRDWWTIKELCALISHMDPETLATHTDDPKKLRDTIPGEVLVRSIKKTLFVPYQLTSLAFQGSPVHVEGDLFEANCLLIREAINNNKLGLIGHDPKEWLGGRIEPRPALQWAKEKEIDYHPILDELIKKRAEKIFPTAHTPLQKEEPLSKSWQDKAQAVAKKRLSEQPDMTWEDAVKDQEIKEAAKYMSKGTCVDRSEYKLREALGPVFNPHRKKGRPKGQ
ncbi:MAG: hypothetical protein K2X08_04780 [Chlamydiales bacterium]|nr:hypothetical protein [Chlamydiales bacterium]